VPPFVVLLATLLAAAGLAVAGLDRRFVGSRARAAGTGLLPLVVAGLLVMFVFGEDTYRDGGISRWDAYGSPGGALRPMLVACVALLAGSAAVLFSAALTARRTLFRTTALAAALGCFVLVLPTIVGFSSN
jgi:hypothetical protein